MNHTTDLFRTALKEFKAADTLLASVTKLIEDEASAQELEVKRATETAERLASGYWRGVTDEGVSLPRVSAVGIPRQVSNELEVLEQCSARVQQLRQELNAINNQLRALTKQLDAALAEEERALLAEKSQRRKRIIRRAAFSVAVACVMVALHFWLSERTILTFEFTVDGKPPSVDQLPQVILDGTSFANGDRISLGHHRLSVTLRDFEPIQREFWAFYGKKDLGVSALERSQGSLSIAVSPSPAAVIVQRNGNVIQQGEAPLRLRQIPVGDYSLVIRRGEYEETNSLKIERLKLTEANIVLNSGSANLSSQPPDAEFELSGGGRLWRGKLPIQIDDVPTGEYKFTARRKGWELVENISVNRGSVTARAIAFSYGSLAVTSNPAGLMASANGGEIGKTPTTLHELRPGQYVLAVTDGENDLKANVTVRPKEVAKHGFAFHYGTVHLASSPPGATVVRGGKDVGKTPLTLERVPAEVTSVELRFAGYVSTNVAIRAKEGLATSYNVRLISERYLAAMNDARRAFDADQMVEARKSIDVALVSDPPDSRAAALATAIDQKAEALRQHQLRSERLASEAAAKQVAADLASIPILSPEDIIKDCWNTPGKPPRHFSRLATIDTAKSAPASVPVAAATDVVVKGIEAIAWPFKRLKGAAKKEKDPRFHQGLFSQNYQNNSYRYFGKIAKIDERNKIVTFVPGGPSKQNYTVFAHVDGEIPVTTFPLQPGAPIWISGRLTTLDEADKSLGTANLLALVNCAIYPPNTLSTNK